MRTPLSSQGVGLVIAHLAVEGNIMKKLVPLSLFVLVLASACAVDVYHSRRGNAVYVEPEFYGTVTYVDVAAHRIDLDYVDAGRHYSRNVYYDEGATQWNGVRYNEIRNGDRITVRGRQDGKRWRAEEVRRHD
jgi:hypothetical protein